LHDVRKSKGHHLETRLRPLPWLRIYRNSRTPQEALEPLRSFLFFRLRWIFLNPLFDSSVFVKSYYPAILNLHWIKWVFCFSASLCHYLRRPAFESLTGPPTIQARQVLALAHLKSKASQYPNSPASVTSQAVWRLSPRANPPSIHWSISLVWMKAAQFPHRCFLASSALTPHSAPIFAQ